MAHHHQQQQQQQQKGRTIATRGTSFSHISPQGIA
jgi:hypothetical protein